MCSKSEFAEFLEGMGASRVTSRWLQNSSGHQKEITAHLTNKTQYRVSISCKNPEDLEIKGRVSDLSGSIKFSESRDKKATKLSFISEDGSEFSISSCKHVAIAYLCTLDPEGIAPQPVKPVWKGPVRSDAREHRRPGPCKAKSGIEKVKTPKKPNKSTLQSVK